MPVIPGPAIPYSRNYKQKYEYMRQQLKKQTFHNHNNHNKGKLEIKVRRSHILEDSYQFVMASKLKLDCLRTKLWITFDGEVGLDYGGIAREWFYAVTIFAPYWGQFYKNIRLAFF